MGYVFISYSSRNQDIANRINEILNKNDIETWIAPNDIPVGFEYAQVITDAIKDCSCFILLLTAEAQNSNWVPREVERAVNYGKRILPLQLEQIDLQSDFQLYISVNHAININKATDLEKEMEKVLAFLKPQPPIIRDKYRLGSIIDDKYEIIEHLEQGENHDVFISMNRSLNKQWLVRAIYKNSGDINTHLYTVNLNKNLDHPFLAHIVDVLDDEDHILIVMDYINGIPLSSVIKNSDALFEEQIIQWGIQIAEFLCYLHSRTPSIFNISIWPSQIILCFDGNIKMRYFAAFQGENEFLAKLRPSIFISPEEIKNSKTDSRTDIYSFGYLLYSLITGRDFSKPPYAVLPLREARPDISKAMEHIILKCIEANPKDRYQSANELLKDLQNIDKLNKRLNNPSLFKRLQSVFKKK